MKEDLNGGNTSMDLTPESMLELLKNIFDKNSKSKFKNWICQCRHLNITAFCCIQIWGSLDPKLKSQLSGVYIFKGFSRERLRYIFNQVPLDENFERFYSVYMNLPKYKKIIVDFQSNSYKIV